MRFHHVKVPYFNTPTSPEDLTPEPQGLTPQDIARIILRDNKVISDGHRIFAYTGAVWRPLDTNWVEALMQRINGPLGINLRQRSAVLGYLRQAAYEPDIERYLEENPKDIFEVALHPPPRGQPAADKPAKPRKPRSDRGKRHKRSKDPWEPWPFGDPWTYDAG